MNNKKLKKILSFIPLIICIIIIWLLASGKMSWINRPKNKEREQTKNVDKVYKNGRLQLKESFEWITEPGADEYAVDYKQPGLKLYGLTVEQSEWENECNRELQEFTKESKLTDKQKGEFKYNKDYVVNVNDEFEIKPLKFKGRVNDIEIRNNVYDDEIEGFVRCEKDNITEYLDSEGNIKDMEVVSKYMSEDNKIVEERAMHKMCFIKVSLTLDSCSDWVQNSQITPVICYLEDNGEALQPIGMDAEKGYYFYGVSSGMNELPAYYDVDFYDNYKLPEQSIYCYPMMNGESISFNFGYIVPEDMLDNVYFLYSNGTSTEYDYCNCFDVLIKAKQ